MHSELIGVAALLGMTEQITAWLEGTLLLVKVLIGFSIIIFVHELGHFLAAKWMGVRVDRFAVGFFYRICGYRRGEGFTFGPRPNYRPDDLAKKGYGETDYCLNALPIGGYVKMLGEDDIIINEQTGEVKHTDDPRAFTNKSVEARMLVVSAGVVFNVAFAILLYALVYLAGGQKVWAPVLGTIEPGSPAGRAGLLPGDKVLTINGTRVQSFNDLLIESLLGEGHVRLTIERDGAEFPEPIVVRRDKDFGTLPTALGWTPYPTNQITRLVDASMPLPDPLQPGDKVVAVNGRPIDDLLAYVYADAIHSSRGRPLLLTIERAPPAGQPPLTFDFEITPRLRMSAGDTAESVLRKPSHLLGLAPCSSIDRVVPGMPADVAGFREGDVILEWAGTRFPTFPEIVAAIHASPNEALDVIVLRDGQRVALTVTPTQPFSLGRTDPPKVGIEFGQAQQGVIVADIVSGTPAASLGLPRGSEILAADGVALTSWADLYEALRAASGRTITLAYRSGQDEGTVPLAVPASIVSELDLPPTARIRSIAGEDRIRLDEDRVYLLPQEAAVRELLARHIGETVDVEYHRSTSDRTLYRAQFTVRADNVDPWQFRASYDVNTLLPFEFLTTRVHANGNPLVAIAMAGEQTVRVLERTYRSLQALIFQSGNVSTRDVAGPVGIMRHAVRIAQDGYADLLFFLAFISINLAVINFLPLPVVDGGLMVFLLLEKIRGKPLNLKVQVITTLAGLALIVLVFLLVTLQDIVKWLQGGY
ncbi:MAG: site-2 protease family protein [Phycisphaerales bacterium]|nr:site-2 protease family protein [Phycisphaerales bacterium]